MLLDDSYYGREPQERWAADHQDAYRGHSAQRADTFGGVPPYRREKSDVHLYEDQRRTREADVPFRHLPLPPFHQQGADVPHSADQQRNRWCEQQQRRPPRQREVREQSWSQPPPPPPPPLPTYESTTWGAVSLLEQTEEKHKVEQQEEYDCERPDLLSAMLATLPTPVLPTPTPAPEVVPTPTLANAESTTTTTPPTQQQPQLQPPTAAVDDTTTALWSSLSALLEATKTNLFQPQPIATTSAVLLSPPVAVTNMDEGAPTTMKRQRNHEDVEEKEEGNRSSSSSLGERLLRQAGYSGQGALGKHHTGALDFLQPSNHIGGHGGLGYANAPKRQRHDDDKQQEQRDIPSLNQLQQEVRWQPDWLQAPSELCSAVLNSLSNNKSAPTPVPTSTDDRSESYYTAMKAELDQLKNRLDTVDARQLREAGGRALWYDGVSTDDDAVNRAKLKLVELDAAAEGELITALANGSGPLHIVELCGAPGGFLTYIVQKLQWRGHVTGMTLRQEGRLSSLRYKEPRDIMPEIFEPFEGDTKSTRPGDVTCLQNLRALQQHVNKGGGRVHLVTADGSVDADTDHNYNQQESLNLPLLRAEVAGALCTLRPTGIFLLKCFDLFQKPSRLLLFLIYSIFERVALVRLTRSRQTNSEWYIWAEGLSVTATQEPCNSILVELLLEKKTSRWWDVMLAPRMDADWHFGQHVAAAIGAKFQQQRDALQRLVRCIEDPTYLVSASADISRAAREQCLSYWQQALLVQPNIFTPSYGWDVHTQLSADYLRSCSGAERVHYSSANNKYPYWTTVDGTMQASKGAGRYPPSNHHEPSIQNVLAERQGLDAWRAVLLPRLLNISNKTTGFLLATSRDVWWIQAERTPRATTAISCIKCIVQQRLQQLQQQQQPRLATRFLPADTLLECTVEAGRMNAQNFYELDLVVVFGYWFLPYHSYPILAALVPFNRAVVSSTVPNNDLSLLARGNPALVSEFVRYVRSSHGATCLRT